MEALCMTGEIFIILTKVTENRGIRNSLLLVNPYFFMKKEVN
jgi:hypothetical protein